MAYNPNEYTVINMDPNGVYRQGLADCTAGLQALLTAALGSSAVSNSAGLCLFFPAGNYLVSTSSGNPTILKVLLPGGPSGQLGFKMMCAGNQATTFVVSNALSGAPYLPLTALQFADYTTYPDASRTRLLWVTNSAETVLEDFTVLTSTSGSQHALCNTVELGAHSAPQICQEGQLRGLRLEASAYYALYADGDVYGFQHTNCVYTSDIGQGGVLGFNGNAVVNHQFDACAISIANTNTTTKQYCVELINGASDINFDSCTLITTGADGTTVPAQAQFIFGLHGGDVVGTPQSYCKVTGGTMIGPWASTTGYSKVSMENVQCQISDNMARGSGAINMVVTESGFVGRNCYSFGAHTVQQSFLFNQYSTVGLNAGSSVKMWNAFSLTSEADIQPAIVWQGMAGFSAGVQIGGIGQNGTGGGSPFIYDGQTAGIYTSENRIANLLDSPNPLLEASYYFQALPGVLALPISTGNIGWTPTAATVGLRRCWTVTTPTVAAGAATLARYFEAQPGELFIYKFRFYTVDKGALTLATSNADSDLFSLQFQFYNSAGAAITPSGTGRFGMILNSSNSWNWYSDGAVDKFIALNQGPGWTEFQSLPICAPTGAAYCKLAAVFIMTNVANNNLYEVDCLDPMAIEAPWTGNVRNRPLQSKYVTLSAHTWPTIANYSLAPGDIIWDNTPASGQTSYKIVNLAGTAYVTGGNYP